MDDWEEERSLFRVGIKMCNYDFYEDGNFQGTVFVTHDFFLETILMEAMDEDGYFDDGDPEGFFPN